MIDFIRFVQYGDLSTSYYVKRGMTVGKNFNRQSGCKFDPSHCWLISIGDNVTFSNRVTVLAHDDSMRHSTGLSKVGRVVIGNNVFVGANTTILPGVSIGDNVIVGANSVVTRSIESDTVVAGNPCKKISSYSDFVLKNVENSKTHPTFDISWTIYSKKKMSKEKKRLMNEMLNDAFGYISLGKYDEKK